MSTDVAKKRKEHGIFIKLPNYQLTGVNTKSVKKKSKRVIKSAKHNLEKKIATDGNPKPFYAYLKSKTKSRTE